MTDIIDRTSNDPISVTSSGGTGPDISLPDVAFDRLSRLAARTLHAPFALLFFLDAERKFYPSHDGPDEPWKSFLETPLPQSLCLHVLTSRETFIVEDVRNDPHTANEDTLVTSEVVAYLGVPLVLPTGCAIGCLCVMDTQARRWTDEEAETLTDLAASAVTEVRLKDETLHREEISKNLLSIGAAASVANCLLWRAEVWETAEGEPLTWSLKILNEETAQRFLPLDIPAGWTYSQAWYPSVHPDDIDRIDLSGDQSIREGKGYSQEFRCRRKDGSLRWLREVVEVEVLGAGRWKAVGICIDITDQKLIEDERRQILRAAQCTIWHADVHETKEGFFWHTRFLDEDIAPLVFPDLLGQSRNGVEILEWKKHPEDGVRNAEDSKEALLSGKPSYAQEFRAYASSGEERWLHEVVTVERRGRHRWHAVGVCTDVTERKRAEEAARERNRLTAFVAEVGAVLTWNSTLSVALKYCAEAAVHHLDATNARFWTLNEEEAVLELVARSGEVHPSDDLLRRIAVGGDEIGKFTHDSTPYYSNAIGDDPWIPDQVWARREGMISYACLPMSVEGRLVGAMALFSHRPLTEFARKALEGVADQIAIAIQRSRAEETLRQMAIRDELTGLFNRREMYRLLKEEIDRYRRYGHPLSLILMDVDQFKAINDTHGHRAGDAALQWIGQRISATIRCTDRPIRHGGDELAVLLPETAGVAALEGAERLRREVTKESFVYVEESNAPIEIPITLSIGIATIPRDGDQEDQLTLAADEALYRAKQQGRNCVVSFSDP